MNGSYAVAVYGVPVGYFGAKRNDQIETDDEWDAAGIAAADEREQADR